MSRYVKAGRDWKTVSFIVDNSFPLISSQLSAARLALTRKSKDLRLLLERSSVCRFGIGQNSSEVKSERSLSTI